MSASANIISVMWHYMKRYILSTLLLLLISNLVFGQDIADSFTKKRLKGYKSITIASTSDPSDYSIFLIDPNGNIIKKEYYSNGELTRWSESEYDVAGNLTYEESHGQIYTYNEDAGDHLPVWDEGYYSGIMYEYSNNKLISATHFDVTENESSYNLEVQYQHDKWGRLVKETYTNKFSGNTGNFKPNTSELNTIYLKDNVEVEEVVYTFKNDTVIATRSVGGKVKGYTYKVLNKNKQPVHVFRTDASKDKIIEYRYSYSKEGYLVEEKVKVLNYDKLDIDIAAGDVVKTLYNSKGLPLETMAYENNKLIYGSTYKYK